MEICALDKIIQCNSRINLPLREYNRISAQTKQSTSCRSHFGAWRHTFRQRCRIPPNPSRLTNLEMLEHHDFAGQQLFSELHRRISVEKCSFSTRMAVHVVFHDNDSLAQMCGRRTHILKYIHCPEKFNTTPSPKFVARKCVWQKMCSEYKSVIDN